MNYVNELIDHLFPSFESQALNTRTASGFCNATGTVV